MKRWRTTLSALLASGALAGAQAQDPAGGLPEPAQVPSVRTACPNYRTVLEEARYPPDAIARQLHAGEAVVDFVVADGRAAQITVVSESDRAFGAAAVAMVAKLECTVTDQPIRLRVPFRFRRSCERDVAVGHSTVTLLARLRGLSTSVPRATAV